MSFVNASERFGIPSALEIQTNDFFGFSRVIRSFHHPHTRKVQLAVSIRQVMSSKVITPKVLVVLAASILRCGAAPEAIPVDALRQDFQIARRALEEAHGGIYRYTSKTEMDRT